EILVDMDVSLKKPGVKFEGVTYCAFPGSLTVGGQSVTWSPDGARTCYNAIEFGNNCVGVQFGVLRVQWVHKWGVYRTGGSVGGNTFISGGQASRCGSSNIGTEQGPGTYTIVDLSSNGET